MMPATFNYSPWRNGGWYVHGVRYKSGAIGCVSRNYPDKRWRIVCDPRPFHEQPTFATRDDAARAEYWLAYAERVSAYESQGMSTSDAQGCADADLLMESK